VLQRLGQREKRKGDTDKEKKVMEEMREKEIKKIDYVEKTAKVLFLVSIWKYEGRMQ